MKKYLAFIPIIFFALAVGFTACNKDDTNGNPKSKQELITQGSWKFKAAATAGGTDISAQVPPFDPCKKDNIITFSASGAGTVSEGATKCNSGDPDSFSFTWSFTSNETQLQVSAEFFDLDGAGNNFVLESITETNLVVSGLYTPPVGPSVQVVITFQH